MCFQIKKIYILNIILILLETNYNANNALPIVVNTWAFSHATAKAWSVIQKSNAIDALVAGCSNCESEQCDYTVGYGGSPDENAETTLDAMIFDGETMNMGAVGALRRIKNAIKVAQYVLETTTHSLLVGDFATEFAKNFLLPEETLTTNYSKNLWKKWKENECQPNYRINVKPDPHTSCGPYKLKKFNNKYNYEKKSKLLGHDTIGMIVMDLKGHLIAGTSTNGLIHKVPGRVGDSPIPGAGAYADDEVGAAVATGDGDIMMRFLPSFLTVEKMRMGLTPEQAAQISIDRIKSKFPKFFGAVLAMDNKGNIGAACNGMDIFPYSFINTQFNDPVIRNITCIKDY